MEGIFPTMKIVNNNKLSNKMVDFWMNNGLVKLIGKYIFCDINNDRFFVWFFHNIKVH